MFFSFTTQTLLLFGAALLSGALNALAGGGSFISFPALVATGVAPLQANATSTIVVWPGSLASASAYRREIAQQNRPLLLLLTGSSFIGGAVGAFLLLKTSQELFSHLLPIFLLLATLLFTFKEPMLRVFQNSTAKRRLPVFATLFLVQFMIGIYGGYFGGGIGILILALLSLAGMQNIRMMNGLRALLAVACNTVAVIIFSISGLAIWPRAVFMICGSLEAVINFIGQKMQVAEVRACTMSMRDSSISS